MSSDDFWSSSPREFFNRLNGYSENERNHLEVKLTQTKMIMYWEMMNNPHIAKRDKPKSFEDFIKSFESKNEMKKDEIKSQSVLFSMMGIKE